MLFSYHRWHEPLSLQLLALFGKFRRVAVVYHDRHKLSDVAGTHCSRPMAVCSRGLFFGLVLCLFLPYFVSASHFRGGQVTVEQTGNGREILVTGEWMYAHNADCGEVEYTYSLDTNCNDDLQDGAATTPCSLDQLPDGAHRYTMSWLVNLDADASCGDGSYLFELTGPGGRWNAAKNANSQQWEAIPSELNIVSGMTHSTPFPLVPKDLKMPVTETFGDEYRYVVPLFSADDEPIVACTFEADPDYMDFSLTYLPFEETPFSGAAGQTQPRLEVADGTCVIVYAHLHCRLLHEFALLTSCMQLGHFTRHEAW